MSRKRGVLLLAAALCAAPLAGCSGGPDKGDLFVNTTPPGASCTVRHDGHAIATVGPTPAIALVAPGGALTVTCRRAGFAEATATVPPGPGWPGLPSLLYGAAPDRHHRRIDITLVPKPAAQAAR